MNSPLRRDQPKMAKSNTTFFTPSYQEEFGYKTAQREQCIRTGSSSGNRRNNPHPPHAFMVWRYPPNQKVLDSDIDASAPIPPINLACPNTNIASTYQKDFEKPATKAQALSSLPTSSVVGQKAAELRSTQSWSFQPPKLSSRLRNNITRYGCSNNKSRPACGAVPTISAQECHHFSSQDTSYSESYQSEQTCQLPRIPSTLPKIPSSVKRRKKQCGGPGKCQPSWLSQWTGPS